MRFLVRSVRPDGSWPIDTNLATWVTTLSVNALGGRRRPRLRSLDRDGSASRWLLDQQYARTAPVHRGRRRGVGVDRPARRRARLRRHARGRSLPWPLSDLGRATHAGIGEGPRGWTGCRLQNRDGGWPTFCRGWGALPFDRSGSDLTAHASRALFATGPAFGRIPSRIAAAFAYLAHATAARRLVAAALVRQPARPGRHQPRLRHRRASSPRTATSGARPRDVDAVSLICFPCKTRTAAGAGPRLPVLVEETALAVEYCAARSRPRRERRRPAGLGWLVEAVESGRLREPTPIGFYFAKLWYLREALPAHLHGRGPRTRGERKPRLVSRGGSPMTNP